MRKDKNKTGRITIMREMELPEGYDDTMAYEIVADGFNTTEKAKKSLRLQGSADRKYLIVQIKTRVQLEQKTVTKLIATQSD